MQAFTKHTTGRAKCWRKIFRPTGHSTSQPIAAFSIVATTMMACSVLSAQETEPKEIPSNSIRLRVVGQNGQKVKDALIHVSVWTDEPFRANQDFVTDANGEATSPLPNQIRILRIWARKENHVPLFAQWWPEMQPNGNDIPDTFTFDLPPGTTIGGKVTDEDGKPIADARVEVMRVSRPEERGGLANHLNLGTWLATDETAVVTDHQGRWELGNVPADVDTVVRLKISHPHFIDDRKWGELQAAQAVTMPLLRDRTAVIRMQRGITLKGRVTDPDGKGVAGAVVVWGDDPYMQNGSQEVRTDDDGHYELPPLRPGPNALTVIAEGWAPQRRTVEIVNRIEPIDFQLSKGERLEIIFADDEGNSIPGVSVGLVEWRGVKSLYNHKHPNVLDTKIPVRADDDGNYVWDWAPEGPVTYSFGKPGYVFIRQRELVATDELVVVVLQPKLTVQGKVVDAVTGEPITAFQVAIRGEAIRGLALGEDGNQFSKLGSYAIESERQIRPYVIRIDALGYEPFTSPEMEQLDGVVKFDARLVPAVK